MTVVEYFMSFLSSLGLTSDRMPIFVAVVALAIAVLLAKPFLRRLGRVVEELFFSNWQLALLASTGLVLSLASGWTTWDGMRNFTGEPLLSLMITFGIQGVMLIVAWLIGESFATGMGQARPDGKITDRKFGEDSGLKLALVLVLAGIATSAVAGLIHYTRSGLDAEGVSRVFAYVGGAILFAGVLIVAARAQTLRSYFDATRVMVRTAVLWVMFLACMATSVFFSFDSLFSTIFPQSERQRAAELRAQNQVAGIVNDIGATIVRSQVTESERLFQTDGWKAYEAHLVNLGRNAQASQGEVERYFQSQMEDRRRSIAQQQERIATAQSGQAGLAQKKLSLTEELSRLKGERPGLADDFAKRKTDVEAINKEIDAKRVEAMAEARGVEGTGKVGEGPIFRQRKAEEASLRDKLRIAEERLRDAQKRFQAVDARLTQIERELSLVDGDIAKLRGEAQTAEQRIRLAEEAKQGDEGPKLDPSRVLPMFEKARVEFRQTPKAELLAQVQQMCSQLYGAMTSTPATKDKVRGVDCDPKTAAEAASRVFALNAGVLAFQANCAGGDKLAQYKGVDALFGFARKCVQDSGLPSKETDELRQKINFAELNRDDKANRFVVTWNAFQDGNRLAYLALAIAIAIDGLVFMSGLFGANAVRSPLSDVPTTKARSAEQLERIVDNALLPHRYENARIATEAMHPDNSRAGYSAVVHMTELDPHAASVVRKVLNAGATIDAVHRDELDPSRYFVRRELYEFLAIAGARAFEKHGKSVQEDVAEKVRLAELEKLLAVELMPEVQANAEVVMGYTHPMNATDDGFMSEIVMTEVADRDRRLVKGVLNAGASHRAVRREKGESVRYEIHSDLYKALARLRVRVMMSGSPQAMGAGAIAGGAVRGPALGGNTPETPRIAHHGAEFAEPYREAPEVSVPTTISAVPNTAPDAEPATVPTAGSFEDEIAEHFAREMNLQTQLVTYLRDQSTLIDTAALQRALDAVMMQDDQLRRILRQARSSIETSIDEALQNFSGLPAGPADGHIALNTLAEILRQSVPVILLTPGLAYDNVVNKMEAELSEDAAAGRLDKARQKKLQMVIDHRSDLSKAQYTDDHWRAVQRSLQRFATGLATLAGVDQRPARLG